MKSLKARIIEHLENRGTYDPEVDDDMIDDLIMNTEFGKEIFKKLKEEGPVMRYHTTSGSILSKINPLMNAYQMTQRNVFQLASKLGINRSDRLKLKIVEQKEKDELDNLLNG